MKNKNSKVYGNVAKMLNNVGKMLNNVGKMLDHVGRCCGDDFDPKIDFFSRPYKFGIWITQINCAEKSVVEAPGGCNQYYFGKEGIIKTFNFEGVQYLAGQDYKMCIRSEAGACYVAFEAEINHFMLQVSKKPKKVSFKIASEASYLYILGF